MCAWKHLTKWKRSLAFGALYSIFAFVFAYALTANDPSDGISHSFQYFAFIGAFVAGTIIWWSVVARKEKYSAGWGAVAGLATSFIHYFFGFCAMILYRNISSVLVGSELYGEPLTGLVEGLSSAVFFLILGNASMGIYFVPVGLLSGTMLGWLQMKACHRGG